MRSAHKRAFRIERNNPLAAASLAEVPIASDEESRHEEIMNALADLKKSGFSAGEAPKVEVTASTENQFLNEFKDELNEARKLREEMGLISQSIAETKREIATMHHTNFGDSTEVKVSNELDAVVTSTERATDDILSAAEQIDADARDLAAQLAGTKHEDSVLDIQEQTVKIFEACNFQDLTGQRVQKVLDTMKFIEGHIDKMIDIWGGLENFLDVSPESLNKKTGDDALLSGPGLADDGAIRSSQNDIDSLFD